MYKTQNIISGQPFPNGVLLQPSGYQPRERQVLLTGGWWIKGRGVGYLEVKETTFRKYHKTYVIFFTNIFTQLSRVLKTLFEKISII